MPCVNTISGPLVIRYKSTDDGTRPINPCDATNPFWVSPDIWLVHPSDNTIDEATTKVGVVTTLKVLVHNVSGAAINNVNVEAFICDFTAGVSPASAITGTGKFTGFVSSIAGGNSGQIVTCTPNWTPTTTQLAINNGHVCMLANCFSDTDGQSVDTMSVDPVTHSLPICCDSHLAQRNIHIVAAAQGQGGAGLKNIPIKLIVANPSQDLDFVVTPAIRRVVGPAAITKNERWMLETSPFIKTISLNGRKRFVLAEQGNIRFTNRAAERKPNLLPTDVTLIGASRFRKFDYLFEAADIGSGRDLRIPLKPGQSTPITVNLQLNTNEAIGSTHTFDIINAAPDGTVLGGARVLTVIVP
ncbi:MAG: hypothetical protein R3C14_10715 [Caldilineaceae bacterium]